MNQMILKRRSDGRSHCEALVAFVSDFGPGRVFTYEELSSVLSDGSDRSFDRGDVQDVVRRAKPMLLRQHQRTLACRQNVGYVMAYAHEHRGIADDHVKRGQRRLKFAVTVMENAKLNEMTPAQRDAHLAQCEINRQLLSEQKRILGRQNRHGELIARLTSRLEQLEGQAADRR